MGGTSNVGDKTRGIFKGVQGGNAYPNTTQERPFKVETPNGIARGTVTTEAGYGNRKQVDWAAKGKANRSGE